MFLYRFIKEDRAPVRYVYPFQTELHLVDGQHSCLKKRKIQMHSSWFLEGCKPHQPLSNLEQHNVVNQVQKEKCFQNMPILFFLKEWLFSGFPKSATRPAYLFLYFKSPIMPRWSKTILTCFYHMLPTTHFQKRRHVTAVSSCKVAKRQNCNQGRVLYCTSQFPQFRTF